MIGQQHHVSFTHPQRGNVNHLKGETVQKVLLKEAARAICDKSTLAVPTIRTSVWTGATAPTRSNRPYSTTRRIFSWTSMGIFPISSRNRVPPSACSNRPIRRVPAPVNAPFSYPKSSDSINVEVKAAQFRVTKGFCQRRDKKCSRAEASSLPVPRAPKISTGRSIDATRETCSWKPKTLRTAPRPRTCSQIRYCYP